VAAAMTLPSVNACRGDRTFRSTCETLEPGARKSEVRARLKRLGARVDTINDNTLWAEHRSFPLARADVCEADFDDRDRLLGAARFRRDGS
jgi:hypothetical protein